MSSIKLNVKFIIEKRRIIFFAKLLGIKVREDIFKKASINLHRIKHNWNANKKLAEKVINAIFSGYFFQEKIKVSIFPNNFYLGAAETKKQLILFGQPIRSKNFSSAIILHEITHIFLSKIRIKRELIIDEIICFLVEEIIYSTENKHIEDIWKKKELDVFHIKALEIAIKYRNKVIYDKLYIKYLFNLLRTNSSKRTLKIVPPVGLLKNIKIKR
ncbi:hypothetical protein KKC00_02985 [Patescibacteria group bacterium]|nr:hypothetical protein [Patescibacteria group bacterium]